MKEVSPDKGLQDSSYTEAEFDAALENNSKRQANKPGTQEVPGLSDEDVKQITVISLMRIYDMLGAILTHLDKDQADALLEHHAQGGLAGPMPSLNLE